MQEKKMINKVYTFIKKNNIDYISDSKVHDIYITIPQKIYKNFLHLFDDQEVRKYYADMWGNDPRVVPLLNLAKFYDFNIAELYIKLER